MMELKLAETSVSQANNDAALFSLLPEGLSTVNAARGRTRLATIMTLRWMAVGGQTLAVLFVYFGLGFS